MHTFRNEEQRAAEVRARLAPAFELAEGLFNFWLTAEKDSWIAKSTLSPLSLHLAMLLDVQALRLFRSVIEQSRRCEGFCATILSRSLYESVLGVAFLLMKRVQIIVEAKGPAGTPGAKAFQAKASSKGIKPTRKDSLSHELRANLYYMHAFIQQRERALEIIGRYPGNKRRVKRLEKTLDRSVIVEQEKAIGPAWSYILRHQPHTYSGLTIEELAKVLHKSLFRWRHTVYPFQSRAVHANDPFKHVEMAPGEEGARLGQPSLSPPLSQDATVPRPMDSAQRSVPPATQLLLRQLRLLKTTETLLALRVQAVPFRANRFTHFGGRTHPLPAAY
jgi:hypothetical protein